MTIQNESRRVVVLGMVRAEEYKHPTIRDAANKVGGDLVFLGCDRNDVAGWIDYARDTLMDERYGLVKE